MEVFDQENLIRFLKRLNAQTNTPFFGLKTISQGAKDCLVESGLLPLHKKGLIILLSCLIHLGGIVLLKLKLCAIVSP
jgi:hypothetical protein